MSRLLSDRSTLVTPAPVLDRRIAAFHRLLAEQVRDVNVLVLGDSTGAGAVSPIRWPRYLASMLATQYPTHTLLYKGWNDSTNLYTTENQTVQTGTGARTINFYNASVSGSAISNALFKVNSMASGFAPDLIFWNFGHNSPQLGDDYRAVAVPAVQEYAGRWPNAAQVILTQNPPAVDCPTITFADTRDRSRAMYDYGMAEGYTVVDTWRTMFSVTNYAATLIDTTDKLHPSPAGSQMQASAVWAAIRPAGLVIPGPGRQSKANRVVIPAANFVAAAGSPTFGKAGDHAAWILPKATDSTITCSMIDWPSEWSRTNILAVWTTATAEGAAHAAFWNVWHQYMGGPVGLNVSVGSDLTAWTSDTSASSTCQSTAMKVATTTLYNRTGLGSKPLALKLQRQGTNAGDTLSLDVYFLGLLIDRAF